MDDLLRRPYTPETPFGSSGDNLWATSPQGWGFGGGVHFLHPNSSSGLAPLTLHIEADDRLVVPEDATYRPSHISLHARDTESGLQLTEDKFITQDDVLVSVLHGRNAGEYSLELTVKRSWGVPEGENELRKDTLVWVHREGPPPDDLRQSVSPGGRVVLVFACAFAPTEAEALKRAAFWFDAPDPVQVQRKQYQKWFDTHIPLFDCSDPWAAKLWYHHWYLVKKNHNNPRRGLSKQDTFSQGRWKDETNSASLSSGAAEILREVRWLKEGRLVRNYAQSLTDNRAENGAFRSWYVDKILATSENTDAETQSIHPALWDAHLIHPAPRKPWDLSDTPGASGDAGSAWETAWGTMTARTQAQFENGDFSRPVTVQAATGERDYFAFPWIDLLLTGVIGLVPRTDDVLQVRPNLPSMESGGWAYFCVQDMPYRNHLLTIVWDNPAYDEDAFHDGDKGLTVYVGGKRLHHQSDLTPFTVNLPLTDD